MACKTGAASFNGSGYYCANNDVSASLPMTCKVGSTCKSLTGTFTSSCTCGYNNNATAFCPLFSGDPQVQSALSASVAVFNGNSVCNTYSRFNLNCYINYPSLLPAFLNFALNFSLIYNYAYPLIQNSQNCITAALLPDYYEILNAYNNLNQQTCPAYYCTNYTSYWQPNQCVVSRKDILNGLLIDTQYSNPCPTGYFCNVSSTTSNSTCVPIIQTLGYPGDFCNFSSQCYSNMCQNNFCLGIRQGEQCQNFYDCMPGFFCNQTSLICQILRKKQQNCDFWYECSNNLVCSLGVCINYFSLPNGAITNLYSNGYSEACYSGFAVSSNNNLYTCVNAPISGSNICYNIGQLCYDSSHTYSKPCQCGLGASNSLYCPSFEGDSYLQNAIANLNNLMMWNQMCNTASRISEACFLRNSYYLGIYYYFATNFTVYQNYSALKNTPVCLEEVYLYETFEDQVKLQNWENSQNNPGDNDDSFAVFLKIVGFVYFLS